MSRAKYKGIKSYKMNTENIKNIIKQQIFNETGQTHPFELRPKEKKKLLLAMKYVMCTLFVVDSHIQLWFLIYLEIS